MDTVLSTVTKEYTQVHKELAIPLNSDNCLSYLGAPVFIVWNKVLRFVALVEHKTAIEI